jgi:FixJ family two-component response regulator
VETVERGDKPPVVHIVDDDASFARAMERRLTHAGYEVTTYASAQQLRDRLPNQTELGCVLLDVQIPGMDGPALQAKLSDLGSTLPIIFVTGHPDIPSTVRAIKAGADDFLTKPVDSADLIRSIELALARQKAAINLKNRLDELRARIGTLTPRQREVFALVIRGKTTRRSPGRWAGPSGRSRRTGTW